MKVREKVGVEVEARRGEGGGSREEESLVRACGKNGRKNERAIQRPLQHGPLKPAALTPWKTVKQVLKRQQKKGTKREAGRGGEVKGHEGGGDDTIDEGSADTREK